MRKKEIKLRKNFLPTFLITIFLWGLLFLIIYFVDPTTFGIIPFFFLLFFLAVFFTVTIIFISKRRGFIAAVAFTFFLILSFLGVGNILNFLLVLGIAIATEIYLSKS